jgi:hypothetical protein
MNITKLAPHEIFVFGSNLAGIHGAGAAKFARQRFGAELGVGCGRTGQCYAIATKDSFIRSRSLEAIASSVADFKRYASNHPDLVFLVTEIGCGLAGYSPKEIAPMFKDCPPNVNLPDRFVLVLLQESKAAFL